MLQPKISDNDLCKCLLKKDNKAFDLIFERYWKRLFLYAYRIFEDKVICEDIVQEVFINLWENAPKEEINHLEAYLFRAVKYRISNAIRNHKQTCQVENVFAQLPAVLSADSNLELEETATIIHHSVERLPEKCKEVFMLSREENLSNRQIASQLNISVRTVEAHLYKALKSLKNNLGEIYFWIFLFFM